MTGGHVISDRKLARDFVEIGASRACATGVRRGGRKQAL